MGVTVPAAPVDTERQDRLLVDAIRRGDDRAFERMYASYRDRIHAFVLSKVRDHGRTEDLVQEVFMSALRQLRASDRPVALKPWLYTIAKNACIDEYRRGTRSREVPTDSDEALESVSGDAYRFRVAPSPAAAVDSKQNLEDLRSAFGGLNENQHRLIVMREFEGRSYDEIGEQLGMTRPMVESGLFRARRRLSEEYEELASGRRCQEVQTAIGGGRMTSARSLGIKERRRFSRHLSHCEPCRQFAVGTGVDAALLQRRTVGQRIAALLPLPLLRRLWEFMHGGSGGGGGAAGGGAAAAGGGGAVASGGGAAVGTAAGAAGGGAGFGGAAAVAAVVLAGAGGGVALGESGGSAHRHAVSPAITRHAGAQARRSDAISASGARLVATRSTAKGGASVSAASSGPGAGVAPRSSSAGAAARSSSGAPAGSGGVSHSGKTGHGAGTSAGAGSGSGGPTGGGSSSGGAGSGGSGATALSGAGKRAATTVSGATDGVKTTVTGVTNGVRTTVSGATNGVATTVSGATNGVKTTVSGVTKGVGTTVSGVTNGVKTTVGGITSGSGTGVANGVKTTVSGATNGVGTTVSGVTTGVATTVTGVVHGVGTTVSGVVSGVASTLGGLGGH